MSSSRLIAVAAAGALVLGVAACGDENGGGNGSSGSNLSGKIAVDGSSTVFPFAQAAAERFRRDNNKVNVTVGESGTGGGFEKFCRGEIDISDASRPIKMDEEAPVCRRNGVRYTEIQVANDGIAVTTNKQLQIKCMTTDELKKLWNKASRVQTYEELNPQFPDQKVSLFGPGTDSGTFDFFTDEINGEEGDTRRDYQPSEDDNVLVQGVSGDQGGLGYFGFSYYEQNQDKLHLVAVNAGGGCVTPSQQTIQDGSYKPLSRPLFMYVSAKAAARPEVKAFLDQAIKSNQQIAQAARIVPLTSEQRTKATTALTKAQAPA